jgi:malate dehydrogenase (oxaloacetate-decarboxylating)
MCVAAAVALASYAEEQGVHDEYITPTMDEPEAFIREAVGVGMQAQREGLASIEIGEEELRRKVEQTIRGGRDAHDALVKAGHILPAST